MPFPEKLKRHQTASIAARQMHLAIRRDLATDRDLCFVDISNALAKRIIPNGYVDRDKRRLSQQRG